jgi:hypothetical protein
MGARGFIVADHARFLRLALGARLARTGMGTASGSGTGLKKNRRSEQQQGRYDGLKWHRGVSPFVTITLSHTKRFPVAVAKAEQRKATFSSPVLVPARQHLLADLPSYSAFGVVPVQLEMEKSVPPLR